MQNCTEQCIVYSDTSASVGEPAVSEHNDRISSAAAAAAAAAVVVAAAAAAAAAVFSLAAAPVLRLCCDLHATAYGDARIRRTRRSFFFIRCRTRILILNVNVFDQLELRLKQAATYSHTILTWTITAVADGSRLLANLKLLYCLLT
jgi:hypothetical protein